MKKHLSKNILGITWMLIAAISFSISNFFVKKAGFKLPSIEIVFFRCFFQMMFVLPFVIKLGGVNFLKTKKVKLYCFRLFFGLSNMIIFYYVLTKIPLANAVSISYSRPIFMIVLSYFLLNEKVGIYRIIPTILGFLGVLILIRPDANGFNPAALLAVLGAFCLTIAFIYIKKLSVTENPIAMLMWFSIFASVFSFPAALYVWITPDFNSFILIILLSFFGFIAQFAIIKAFFWGEASIVAAIDYSQIIFTAVLGMIFLHEIPDFYTYLGILIITGSSLFILFREKYLVDKEIKKDSF